DLHTFPTRRSSDLSAVLLPADMITAIFFTAGNAGNASSATRNRAAVRPSRGPVDFRIIVRTWPFRRITRSIGSCEHPHKCAFGDLCPTVRLPAVSPIHQYVS